MMGQIVEMAQINGSLILKDNYLIKFFLNSSSVDLKVSGKIISCSFTAVSQAKSERNI